MNELRTMKMNGKYFNLLCICDLELEQFFFSTFAVENNLNVGDNDKILHLQLNEGRFFRDTVDVGNGDYHVLSCKRLQGFKYKHEQQMV